MSFRPPRSLPVLSIFHSPQCSKSRAALALMQSRQKKANGDDYYRLDVVDNFTKDQLRQVVQYLSQEVPPKDILRPEAQGQSIDTSTIVEILKSKPDMLERPIVVDWERGKAVLGRPTLDAVQKLIDARTKK
ncbi:uncharacterized protein BYT42DRAFT_587225 [Radiomyces spectabilis]|uniref:uncharacterized protein n=1 Tax=Radiomyces spectabilis TaxID=64574 RepID=UPI0022207085|nr:uncharacterized protein BYT42DRAFT_587225 [Radiomyces spectabilis]KAI8366621.1 hypothetical protein BYT42DRAFT_587225 [Radiomyces spectabilis]